MLGTIEDALGSPVEIEYAVDLNQTKNGLPSFYLLQIKPLVGSQLAYNIDLDKINKSDILLYTQSSLGNGELTDVQDVVFVDINRFDKLKTYEIAKEVEKINLKMMESNKGLYTYRTRPMGNPRSFSGNTRGMVANIQCTNNSGSQSG